MNTLKKSILLAFVASIPVTQAAIPTRGPVPASGTLPTKIQGTCRIMNPPGTTPELLVPCNQVTLQLIYKKENRPIVSVVKTQKDGSFELNIPKGSSWSLRSLSSQQYAEVDFLKNPDGTLKAMVILKPQNTQVEPKKRG